VTELRDRILFSAIVDRLHNEGAKRAKIMAVAIHPDISGQPHRIRYPKQVMDAAGRDGVIFMNTAELLDCCQGAAAGA
jgi:allantoinase